MLTLRRVRASDRGRTQLLVGRRSITRAENPTKIRLGEDSKGGSNQNGKLYPRLLRLKTKKGNVAPRKSGRWSGGSSKNTVGKCLWWKKDFVKRLERKTKRSIEEIKRK